MRLGSSVGNGWDIQDHRREVCQEAVKLLRAHQSAQLLVILSTRLGTDAQINNQKYHPCYFVGTSLP